MDPDTILNFLNLIVNFIFGLASAVAALLSIRAFYETRKGQASTFHDSAFRMRRDSSSVLKQERPEPKNNTPGSHTTQADPPFTPSEDHGALTRPPRVEERNSEAAEGYLRKSADPSSHSERGTRTAKCKIQAPVPSDMSKTRFGLPV
ncbi:hypothetical protein MMC10_009371 [Thelotrema lepadinum]|nr:hypothetical protein [Thelotrema lepadinum]